MAEMRGLIVDLKRTEQADGKIDTTVFFKGCPLHCHWCACPESMILRRRPVYVPAKCDGCGRCLFRAEHGGVKWHNELGGRIALDYLQSEDWSEIIAACPHGALSWNAYSLTAQETVQAIRADIPAAKQGRVLLAGGEPLLQLEFCVQLLSLLQKYAMPAALATTLYVPEMSLLRVQPYLEVLYAGFWIYDSSLHRKYTGVPNGRIKKNIQVLLESFKRQEVVVRTPLILQPKAEKKNLAAISGYLAGFYPEVRFEIGNFIADEDLPQNGLSSTLPVVCNTVSYTQQEVSDMVEVAVRQGLTKVSAVSW